MTQKFKKYWHLFWRFRSLRLQAMMNYRSDFFFWTFVSLMWTAFNYFFLGLILNIKGEVAGWSYYEVFVLASTYTMLDAFTWSFFAQNMWQYTSDIYEGQLTVNLSKPVDLQFLIMTQDNTYHNLWRFFVGLATLIWSLQQLNYDPTLWQILLFLISFITGWFFMYLIWFMVATMAFWVERLNNIHEIAPSVRQAYQFPRSIYTGVLSTLFTVVLPIALVTSLPAETLIGRQVGWYVLYFVLFTVCLFIFARWFFKFSLTRYAGVAN